MKAIKGSQQFLAEGRQSEKAGNLSEAAMSFEKVVDSDPSNQEAVARLLIIYRKLKDYRKELAVIDNAIGAYKEKDKAIRENWLRTHPGAAGAGRAVLRSLGGNTVSAFGTDPVVTKLRQRKELVERKISGGSGRNKRVAGQITRKKDKEVQQSGSKNGVRALAALAEKRKSRERQREVAEQRKQEVKAKREAAEQRKQEVKAKREVAEQRKQEAKAKRKETEQRKQEVKSERAATLFVITLRYLVPLEQIEADMHQHVAFLDKYYKSGHILISGRQVPRTGGVIIATARDRDAVERMINQDPFVKKKLASADIMQFSASRIGKGLSLLLKRA